MKSRSRVRKKHDSWQVVYMDLMTNVMIFFVILWSLNQGKDQGVDLTVGNESAQLVNLPGDVLFKSGKWALTKEGKDVFKRLFSDENGSILTFDENPAGKRMLVVHGHTDGDGKKRKNLDLGYQRAVAAYEEIARFNRDVHDHVIICSHADNTPEQEVPKFTGRLTPEQMSLARGAKAKNRRITIEDKVVDQALTP